jgi:hypothetical protein
MPVDFLSDTPWEDFICSPWSQKGGVSQWNCACNSLTLCGSFCCGCRYDIDPPVTEMKMQICEIVDSESIYNKNYLYLNKRRLQVFKESVFHWLKCELSEAPMEVYDHSFESPYVR